MPVRISRGIKPDELGLRPRIRVRGIDWNGSGACQTSTDVVGRVRGLREQNSVARTHSQKEWQPCDSFLRSDCGKNSCHTHVHHIPALTPIKDCAAKLNASDHGRIPRSVRAVFKGSLDELGRRIDRCTNGEITHSLGVLVGTLAVRRELIPRKVRKIKWTRKKAHLLVPVLVLWRKGTYPWNVEGLRTGLLRTAG